MRFCKLRIAWSVFWGSLLIAFVFLWVRSHYQTDLIVGPWYSGGAFNLASVKGELGLSIMPAASLSFGRVPHPSDRIFAKPEYCSRLGFKFEKTGFSRAMVIPYWCFAFAIVLLAAVSWIPKRFNIRTLLIATTLVAVVLGLIVWMLRACHYEIPQAANRVVDCCGIACVLLIVFWVRSYSLSTTTQILVTPQIRYYLHSVAGTVAIHRWYRSFRAAEFMPSFPKSEMSWLTTNKGDFNHTKSGSRYRVGQRFVLAPHSGNTCHWDCTLAPLAILPPHSANRHDAGCHGAGADRVAAVTGAKVLWRNAS